MKKSQDNNGVFKIFGNWDWQPQKLKEQFEQLTLSDVKYVVGKEKDLLTRIGIRINKPIQEVMIILKKLKPF